MAVTISIADGALAQTSTDKSQISGLFVVKHLTSIVPGEAAPPFSTATRLTSYKQAVTLASTAGTAHPDIMYIIADYFEANPNGILWVKCKRIVDDPVAFDEADYDVLTELHNPSGKQIRQMAVVSLGLAYSATNVADIHAYTQTAESENVPFVMLYSCAYDASVGSNVRALLLKRLTLDIGVYSGAAYPTIGLSLGLISRAKVHQSAARPRNFKVNERDARLAIWDSTEIDTFSESELEAMTQGGFLFFRRRAGLPGVYLNSMPNCADETSDFNRIQRVRAMDKALRGLYEAYAMDVEIEVYLDSTGKIDPSTLAYLKGVGQKPLNQMLNDREISAFEIGIDPDQNVSGTNLVQIVARLVPVGTGETIDIPLSFAASVSS